MKSFSKYHPTVNLLFFTEVIGFAMFFMHPAALLISLVCAFLYAVSLRGKRAVMFFLKFSLPAGALAALVNSAFNHRGVTILCYLPSGNPLTAESILYGLASALMLTAVLFWFECFSEIMTTDKFIYLFGRVIPSLSLVLSMALRFVPKLTERFNAVKEAQESIGITVSRGSIIKRIKNAVKILSITVTWSLENAVETADSMKSRGYGLSGRSSFSIYRFDEKDKTALALLFCAGLFLICGSLAGALSWRYFPSISSTASKPLTQLLLAVYFALCISPVIIDKREEKRWSFLQSKL